MDDQDPFITALSRQLASIGHSWQQYRDDWNATHLDTLYQRVQELSEGSADRDMLQLHDSALSLEVYLSSFVDLGKTPSSAQLDEIETLLTQLRAVAGELSSASPATLPERCTRTFYALLDSDGPAKLLLAQLRAMHCQLQLFDNDQSLLQAMQQRLPGAILADTAQLDELPALSGELSRLHRQQELDIPLVFVSDDNRLSTRLAAMRAGASAYFIAPYEPAELVARMQRLIQQPQEAAFRVTVVEDDPGQADFAATILRRGGMEVDVVTDPMTVMEALQTFQPDLILMDIYMPAISGLELTRIIRDFPDFVTTPIVFLSGERDSGKQMAALHTGGDDFIAKPIDPQRLLSLVENRIRRSRKVHAVLSSSPSVREPATPLPDQTQFTAQLADVLAGRDSDGRHNALLYLRPEALIAVQAQLGIEGLASLISRCGDQLTQLLGSHDQACRWDDQGLMVLLRGEDEPALESAAERLHQAITDQPHPDGLEPIRFCAGLHHLSGGEEDIDSALRGAMQACSTAQQDSEEVAIDGPAPAPILLPIAANMDSILREALEQDRFDVYYQPLLDLQARGSENYEILPALALPDGQTLNWRVLAEHAARTGLQTEFDRWLLGRAMDILIERRNSGRKTHIFVRQSGATATSPEHAEWLAGELQRRRAEAIGLVLDYPLAELSQDIAASRDARQAMQALGVELAISRFVAKPAAYKVLRYLDGDYVRVARKLLKADRDTISSVIQQTHKLEAKVIVSHVDDPRDIDLHWSSGADYLQGDFIQQPLEDMDYDFSQVVI